MNHYDNVIYKVYYKKAKMCILRQKRGTDQFMREMIS